MLVLLITNGSVDRLSRGTGSSWARSARQPGFGHGVSGGCAGGATEARTADACHLSSRRIPSRSMSRPSQSARPDDQRADPEGAGRGGHPACRRAPVTWTHRCGGCGDRPILSGVPRRHRRVRACRRVPDPTGPAVVRLVAAVIQRRRHRQARRWACHQRRGGR